MRAHHLLAVGCVVVFAALFVNCGASPTPCTTAGECAKGERCVDKICQSPETDGGRIPCSPGQICRPAAGDCDLDEVCGQDGFCPEDVFNAGKICRPPAGPCGSR